MKVNVLSDRHALFVAYLVQQCLIHNGIECHVLLRQPKIYDDCLHIIICAQKFKKFPKRYWAFQLEQSVSMRWFTAEYFRILAQADLVLDYSKKNISFLKDSSISPAKLRYCPISCRAGIGLTRAKDTQYDIIFYGDPKSPRRQQYLSRLQEQFKVKIVKSRFGEKLYPLVANARIVVNIHYYENGLLETTRIYEALSLGAVIVSEVGSDQLEHSELEGVVSFCPMNDIEGMVNSLKRLLQDRQLYISQEQAVRRFAMNNIGAFNRGFGRILRSEMFSP